VDAGKRSSLLPEGLPRRGLLEAVLYAIVTLHLVTIVYTAFELFKGGLLLPLAFCRRTVGYVKNSSCSSYSRVCNNSVVKDKDFKSLRIGVQALADVRVH
jgi:hypothetical protein